MSTHLPRLYAGLAAIVLLVACKKADDGHEHASDHPPGHDHHDEGHGHGETPMMRVTLWSEKLELFAEHPIVVAGSEASLLAHITVLKDFSPLDAGVLRLELDGPVKIQTEARAPLRAGIYQLTFKVGPAGTYRGRLIVEGSAAADTIDGIVIEAHAPSPVPRPDGEHEDHNGGQLVEFLKEQQWGVPFATAFASPGTLIASADVAGEVTTPPGGSAEIGAPMAGRLIAPAQGLPRPGDLVRKGQILATLAPAPSSGEDAARATLGVSEAEARLARARAGAESATRLLRDQAISQREFDDAQRESSVAEEALRAARKARELFAGAAGAAGSWQLVVPIDGTLDDVAATPGAAVSPGTVLFRVVDTRELWIRARVPEQDAPRVRSDRDASFQIAGLEGYLPIDVTGDDANASLITLGRTVHPASRTVDLIYALRAPDPRLRVGGLVRVSVPASEDFSGIVLPKSAVLDDGGRQVVFVQIDGEHFEERTVRTGAVQGARIGITHGLTGTERVVTRGAHVVRLASQANTGPAHGHIH